MNLLEAGLFHLSYGMNTSHLACLLGLFCESKEELAKKLFTKERIERRIYVKEIKSPGFIILSHFQILPSIRLYE